MLRTEKGIFPLKVLSELLSPWDSMESLDVVGKGGYDSQRALPLWLALSRCFTAIDLCHFPTRIFLDVVIISILCTKKAESVKLRFIHNILQFLSSAPPALCRLREEEDVAEEEGRPCL